MVTTNIRIQVHLILLLSGRELSTRSPKRYPQHLHAARDIHSRCTTNHAPISRATHTLRDSRTTFKSILLGCILDSQHVCRVVLSGKPPPRVPLEEVSTHIELRSSSLSQSSCAGTIRSSASTIPVALKHLSSSSSSSSTSLVPASPILSLLPFPTRRLPEISLHSFSHSLSPSMESLYLQMPLLVSGSSCTESAPLPISLQPWPELVSMEDKSSVRRRKLPCSTHLLIRPVETT
jgi:hypothetical protein